MLVPPPSKLNHESRFVLPFLPASFFFGCFLQLPRASLSHPPERPLDDRSCVIVRAYRQGLLEFGVGVLSTTSAPRKDTSQTNELLLVGLVDPSLSLSLAEILPEQLFFLVDLTHFQGCLEPESLLTLLSPLLSLLLFSIFKNRYLTWVGAQWKIGRVLSKHPS